MPQEFRVRQAGIDDLETVLHHRVRMFEDMGGRDPAVLDHIRRLSRTFFDRALREGTYRAWLAETTDGEVVGGGGVLIADGPGSPGENEPRRAWILNVYTEPEFRRRGVARSVMQIILEWCGGEGFATIYLHASPEGRALYESLGFQRNNEMKLMLR